MSPIVQEDLQTEVVSAFMLALKDFQAKRQARMAVNLLNSLRQNRNRTGARTNIIIHYH